MFVTAQGSPTTRFKRAIERRSIINAELAAREMGSLSLEQALALVVLYAEGGDPRAERAMVRWLGRLFLEHPMPFDLAARCFELVAELRGPEAERAAGALDALVRT
jgi:hypothetical protein